MKKTICVLFIALTMSSCATVFGGKVTTAQRTKPSAGQPSRPVRGGALVADILLCTLPCVIIDFATCAIYKPTVPGEVKLDKK